jgi:hypothetical protein
LYKKNKEEKGNRNSQILKLWCTYYIGPTSRYLGHSEQRKDLPNTEENRKADPNPRESPIAFVSGACIRK